MDFCFDELNRIRGYAMAMKERREQKAKKAADGADAAGSGAAMGS